ncbi:MAG: helix-turn-helix transcriptional regulator [Lentisphaerae bacterium]|nr:helix-turn-helix transcriptional regulator [Lentisphaerota bacterium]
MSNTTKKQLSNTAGNELELKIHIAQYLEHVQWNCDQVIHPNWMLFWNPTPGARIICGTQEYIADSSYAYMIPAFTTISGFSDRKFEHFYTHFEVGEPFDRPVNQIYRLDPEPAKRFFAQYHRCSALQRQLYWRVMIMEYLALLPEKALNCGKMAGDQRIRKALQIASRHLDKTLDNSRLARMVGMSLNNFYRVFRLDMKITPQKYFLNMRLNAARKVLLEQQMDIAEAAEKFGFADRYQFSKAFKKYFGIPPGRYLMQCRREKEKNMAKIEKI